MDLTPITGLLHSPEVHQYAHRALEAVGVLALAPRLLMAATPLAMRAADRVASVLLSVPVLRSVVIVLAPDIVKFLDDTTTALDKLVDTFRLRLEKDIAEAAAADKAGDPAASAIGKVVDPPPAQPPKA